VISVDKPGSPEQLALEHYGKQGMKWGVRKSPSSTSSKSPGREIIKARLRNESNFSKIQEQHLKVRDTARGSSQRTAQEARLNAMQAAFLKSPDRATALRLTTGEKWVAAALAVALPGPGTVGVGVGVGTRVLIRKGVEKDIRKRQQAVTRKS
jgi:hypothetical protein